MGPFCVEVVRMYCGWIFSFFSANIVLKRDLRVMH